MKRKRTSSEAPFVGNGHLTDYKTKKDSWILKQIEDGKPNNGIKIDKSDEQHWRFASKCRKIASKLVSASETFTIDKFVKQLSSTSNHNYRFYLKWSLIGEFNGASLNELAMVKEMLFARINGDVEKLNYLLNLKLERMGEVSIDFSSSSLICEAIIDVEVNVVTNVSNILEHFKSLGFDTGDAI